MLPTRIILMYNEVPERIIVYDLIIKDEETQKKLLACHGVFGNTEDCPNDHPVVEWLCQWLEGQKERIVYITKNVEVDPRQMPINVDTLATLVVTGFVL